MDFLTQKTFRSLRHPNFRFYFFGQLISFIGSWTQQTALSWMVYQLTNSEFLLGLVTAVGTLPLIIFPVLGGALVDRYSKYRTLMMTQIAMMILAFTLAFLSWMGWINIWWIIVLLTLSNVVLGIDIPTRVSFLTDMTDGKDLMNAYSLNVAIFNIARIVGPMIAAFIMTYSKIEICFGLNGLSFAVVIVALLCMKLPKYEPSKHPHPIWKHMTEGMHYAWNHSPVLISMILFTVVAIFGWSYIIMMPAFAKDTLHVGEKGFGILMSAIGLGACVGSLTAATLGHSFKPKLLIFGGVGISATGLILCIFNQNFYWAVLILTIVSFGSAVFYSTTSTFVQAIVPSKIRGRIIGIWSSIISGTTPIGSFEIGTLSSWTGVPWACGINGIICAVSAAIAGFLLRKNKDLTQPLDIKM